MPVEEGTGVGVTGTSVGTEGISVNAGRGPVAVGAGAGTGVNVRSGEEITGTVVTGGSGTNAGDWMDN